MNRIEEKFNKFSYMVMKEANKRKKEMISQAEKDSAEMLSEKEALCLKKAYDHIHESLVKIEREHNEEVSKAILDSKQTLFNRREEIIQSVFSNVRGKLEEYKRSEDYMSFMKEIIMEGLEKIGHGEIQIFADHEDISLIEEIRVELGASFNLSESEEHLLGGCLMCNKTRGIMYDCSFIDRLEAEKSSFLENYGLFID
ncbi:MAG: V-type ATP synthase subunit E [Acetivibrionales bacterium]|jgi:V/A-type H+-transporting ATPase subunit E